ncbi:MAG: PEP-CTERM sorting domain-containing protein [Burkholderiaceae bacterium]|nr:PEP-CTERM sorting domain-containing protein [Burkholderiaceae bacterium]
MSKTQLCRGAALTSNLLALLGMLASPAAQAAIATGNDPELLFVMWDPITKVSYTKDLGMRANTFWITAQQDAGSQTLVNLTSADKNFAEFLKVSTLQANQRWGIFAIDSGPETAPGDTRLFTTLTQGPAEGVTNPHWLDMTRMQVGDLTYNARHLPDDLLLGALNQPGPDAKPNNSHWGGDFAANGSSFDTATSLGYFAGRRGFFGRGALNQDGDAFAGAYSITNAVGFSSWFYYLTHPAQGSVVAVDEFDNLGGNGYWGLAFKSAGNYLLSYTMDAYNPTATVSSAEGRFRLSSVDFAAGFAARRIDAPEGEFPAYAAGVAAAVPEPASWASFGLGLLALAWVAGRRSSGR